MRLLLGIGTPLGGLEFPLSAGHKEQEKGLIGRSFTPDNVEGEQRTTPSRRALNMDVRVASSLLQERVSYNSSAGVPSFRISSRAMSFNDSNYRGSREAVSLAPAEKSRWIFAPFRSRTLAYSQLSREPASVKSF